MTFVDVFAVGLWVGFSFLVGDRIGRWLGRREDADCSMAAMIGVLGMIAVPWILLGAAFAGLCRAAADAL